MSPVGYEDLLGPYKTHNLYGAVKHDAGQEWDEHERESAPY